jgi:hypothetical protein
MNGLQMRFRPASSFTYAIRPGCSAGLVMIPNTKVAARKSYVHQIWLPAKTHKPQLTNHAVG